MGLLSRLFLLFDFDYFLLLFSFFDARVQSARSIVNELFIRTIPEWYSLSFQPSPPDFLHFDSFHLCSPFFHIRRPSVLFLRMALSLGTRVSLCRCLPPYFEDACLLFIMRTALFFFLRAYANRGRFIAFGTSSLAIFQVFKDI